MIGEDGGENWRGLRTRALSAERRASGSSFSSFFMLLFFVLSFFMASFLAVFLLFWSFFTVSCFIWSLFVSSCFIWS